MNLDVNDSEVGQLNVAERIEQHYHADTDAFSPPSLSDMQFAYQTSEATLKKARFWFAVCELPWMGLTAIVWAGMARQLPPHPTALHLFAYTVFLAFIPFTVRALMPDQLKVKRAQWKHVIEVEAQCMKDLHHQIVREQARLRLLARS
ncbi:hypothetical protein FQK02_06325 [Xanthomonas vasicola]|nr:hypothetical protein [Xanthomonas vasicola]KFA29294.1 hypothetical protein KWG_0115860 [Xanthomonas vasicola pv. vasculorum NCPPB 1381]KFA31917.1 hypothetical protein KW5_0101500 [Xanthomonas vasicola pv. vasculorum NCPPB 1326]MBV6747882.1 hypothetical protein [Xanthomonas vasicola pv. vasculorum NCPPB 890]MBV6894220.1 hypothetical protein [Xanthomonas vasicola pv. vasculorum]MDO6950111.1 hypothetical protein [Xanthomonas vasicola]